MFDVQLENRYFPVKAPSTKKKLQMYISVLILNARGYFHHIPKMQSQPTVCVKKTNSEWITNPVQYFPLSSMGPLLPSKF